MREIPEVRFQANRKILDEAEAAYQSNRGVITLFQLGTRREYLYSWIRNVYGGETAEEVLSAY